MNDGVAPAAQVDASTRPKLSRKLLRAFLISLVPIAAVIAGAYWYVVGARYISTDNAYVKAGKATISAEVEGRIATILVTENQDVVAGQPLVKIDDETYRIALARAVAEKEIALARVKSLHAQIHQKREELKLAEIAARQAEREFLRGAALADRNVMSAAKFDEARSRLESAKQQKAVIFREIEEIVAQLGGDERAPPDRHPAVLQMQAAIDEARLALRRTTLLAPLAGTISRVDSIRVGDFVRPAAPLFSIVALDHLWIEANFKETDLTRVRAGQPVKVTIDTFPDVAFKATVHSLGASTGAEFALIPPQNATGNWVKVVQRIPVRIQFSDQNQLHILKAGMSANVTVDTNYIRPVPEFLAGLITRADSVP